MIVVFVSLFLEKLFKNLTKERKYNFLCEECNLVRKSLRRSFSFLGYAGPADILGSVYWEVCSEHLSTSHLLDFAALIICITV